MVPQSGYEKSAEAVGKKLEILIQRLDRQVTAARQIRLLARVVFWLALACVPAFLIADEVNFAGASAIVAAFVAPFAWLITFSIGEDQTPLSTDYSIGGHGYRTTDVNILRQQIADYTARLQKALHMKKKYDRNP